MGGCSSSHECQTKNRDQKPQSGAQHHSGSRVSQTQPILAASEFPVSPTKKRKNSWEHNANKDHCYISNARQPTNPMVSPWTQEAADKLQESVDRIFCGGAESPPDVQFSLSIADPLLEGCPLIGCSTGFTALCGYELKEIVGRDCRFLVDSVPEDRIDKQMRKQTKNFCEAVRLGQANPEPLFARQLSARKDGTLFYNMFYWTCVVLGLELGQERPYIVALQSELASKEKLGEFARNLPVLYQNMTRVKRELSDYIFSCGDVSRQLHLTNELPEAAMKVTKSDKDASQQLYASFDADEVEIWDKSRFKVVKKLAEAARNGGAVYLAKDTMNNKLVSVKQMPKTWTQKGPEEFLRQYPGEIENPWQDLGCMRFLNAAGFEHTCDLVGVYHNADSCFVVSSFASGGDLFTVAKEGKSPGSKREEDLAPIVIELLTALQNLHGLQIVHRDVSLENVVKDSDSSRPGMVRLIDFGMASVGRYFQTCPRGKPAYSAPEMHKSDPYDAFLTDAFSAGVVIYCLLVGDYPWLSTKPGRCECFEYVESNGFREFCRQRQVRGTSVMMDEVVSPEFMQLVEGLLEFDPSQRLTLGETQFGNRRSVWDEPWVKDHMKQQ